MTAKYKTPSYATPEAETPLWSYNNIRVHPGPSETVILQSRVSNGRLIVQTQVAEALRLCSTFRSLDDHKQTIINKYPSLNNFSDEVQNALDAAVSSGILESAGACWERLTTDRRRPDNHSGTRLFILTCDRPAALERLLTTLSPEKLPSDTEGIWVIDDSRDARSVAHNRHIIAASMKANFPCIYHFDLNSKRDFVQALKDQTPNLSGELEWLLTRDPWGSLPTFGVARNIALLLSVGKKALMIDDDVILNALAPPVPSANLRFGTPNEREAVFYNSEIELSKHALLLEASPLIKMREPLGHTLSRLLSSNLAGPQDLAGMDGEQTKLLSGDSSVLMTQCGSWGDPGTSDSRWIFHLPSSSLHKLLSETSDIESLVGSRQSWHGYRGPFISAFGSISQLTGLDHQTILPPYLPAGRGEDILFGIMLNRLHPRGIVFNAPWAIHHAPLDLRDDRASLTPLSSPVSTALLVDWLSTDETADWGLSPLRRLNIMAEKISQLSEMDSDALTTLIQEVAVSRKSHLLNHCMTRASELSGLEGLPGLASWRRFIEASRDNLVAEIQASDEAFFEPKDHGVSNAISTLQDNGEKLSRALTFWPEICEAAQIINV